MPRFSPERRRARLHAMPTETLLDRVTVLRDQMDTDALEIMESVLAGRGVGPEEISRHGREMQWLVVRTASGSAALCGCGRAAVVQKRQWHRWWGLIPLFQRTVYYCVEHQSSGSV